MKYVLIMLAAGALIGANVVIAIRDDQIMQAAVAYEQCVKREYGMTPIQWYEQHNKYPLCGN